MKEETRIPRAQLAKGTESTPVVWSLVSAAESDALLVVDIAELEPQTRASRERRSRRAGRLPLGRRLLAARRRVRRRRAERRPNAECPVGGDAVGRARRHNGLLTGRRRAARRRRHVGFRTALRTRQRAHCSQRRSFPSLSEVHSSRVLCAVSGSTALDVFAVPSARAARREACVPLGFALLCFTCGVCDGVTLLFAKEMDALSAHSGGAGRRATRAAAAAPRRRRRPTPLAHRRPPLRRRVERAVGDGCSARVACVARRAARRAPRRHSHRSRRQHRINCWCPVGEKIALYDWKTRDIVVYSCSTS